jgi:quercetin 2,3-dioxygenase
MKTQLKTPLKNPRRKFILAMISLGALPLGYYFFKLIKKSKKDVTLTILPLNTNYVDNISENKSMILQKFPLGFQWPTQEPFLFCVHHLDHYPEGNGQMGINYDRLGGRNIGSDFEEKDGFRMYHGDHIPGFPVHPHRGFETVTVVRKGYIDHADSMGAAGRYGEGDTQWMTAGRGVQHSEMFPLLHTKKKNTVELFQIWLNLPSQKKMSEPNFTMFWNEKTPQINLDSNKATLTLIAGDFDGHKALAPPPESWASNPNGDVAIWLFTLKKGAKITLPKASNETKRTLYLFEGPSLKIADEELTASKGAMLKADVATEISSPDGETQFLVLQAKPIGEPVVQHGPFVMNTRQEIVQTIQDYQQTEFGGWPWKMNDMVHGDVIERFAKYPNGKIEKPTAPKLI